MTQPEPVSPDRLKGSLETLFQLMGPRAAYALQWEGVVLLAIPPTPVYTPVSPPPPGPLTFVTPATVNVQLTDPEALEVFGTDFSTIPIPLWSSPGGFVSVPTIGSLVRVGFVNGSPSKPYIAGLDPMVLPTLSAGVVLRAFALALSLDAIDPAVATACLALNAALGSVG